ncbi:MAG: hypothetical protein EXR77_13640 [Myxococcales bacterium]|nr:hypothetical protein [Myxococcales bacterium]
MANSLLSTNWLLGKAWLVSTVRWLPLALVLLATLASSAFGQEINIAFKIRGFSADQKQMLVEVDDENASGPVLKVYDVDTITPAKKSQPIPFTKADGPKAIREARKKLKFVDAGVEDMLFPLDPKDESKSLSFFGLMAAKDRFVIAVTDKQRLGKVKDVPIKVDAETKILAKANLRGVFWTTDRKLMVAIVNQKIETGTFTSEKDEFHVIKFKPADVSWVDPAPEPAPAPK